MDKSNQPFGLLIAYVLPGFIGLGGIAMVVPVIARWLAPPAGLTEAGIGAPVYALLVATALGMILSCIRWLIIDHIHHWTGLNPPRWNLAALERRLESFSYIVEGTYRYYQFYSNTLIAVVLAYVLIRCTNAIPFLGLGTDLVTVLLCAVLFAGSRDALAKYYQRSSQLVG
jgi:hypothetical protein